MYDRGRERGRGYESLQTTSVTLLLVLVTLLQLTCPSEAAGHTNTSGGPTLLYTTNKEVRITNLSRPSKTNIVMKGLEEGAAVDFYMEGQLICWTDIALEKIKCISHNGTQANEKVVFSLSGLNSPVGLAIDWYTQKLYWADRDNFDIHRIEVCSFASGIRKVLFWTDIDQPRAITVAPMKGLLFWTDWGEEAKIERAGMNGDPDTRKVIVDKDIYWPNGLTIDYETNKIYWLDARLHFIDVMDFDGQNRRTIMKGGLDYGYALTIFNMKLYWTDWKTWFVHSWDMNTKGPTKDLIHSDDAPGDVKVWSSLRQPLPATPHPCHFNNGNCSHLCLLASLPPGYLCACPTGVKLLNKWQCANGPQSQIIIVQKMALSLISLDSPDYTSFGIPLQNIKSAVAVDYDSVTGFVYWTDDEARTISRSRLNGSEQSIVIQGDLGNLDGLAIDSAAGNLYWTDPAADTITTSRLDGSSRKVLINEDLDSPRGIAIASSLGWMFWSDWSKPPKIERAALDGSDRVLLISDRIYWPNGIALDIKAKKMYWGDAHIHKIEVCNMDGSERRELISDTMYHIFSLSLLGDYLYWTDWHSRSLIRVHKIIGGEREIIAEQVHNVMGVKGFEFGEVLIFNPCSYNNGNCSHLCFNLPKDYICDCPITLELGKDNKTCVKPAAFLVYARKDKIGRLSIENLNNDATLPVKDVKGPNALTIHAAEGHLYWADVKAHSIGRCAINGSNAEKVIEWTFVESLALDWCGRNLYWIDSTSRIEVSKLDGSNRRTLIWQGLRKPRSLVLDPLKGYMYWSEWGSKSIKRADMDGSHSKSWMESVGRAYALTIDYELEDLIWVTLDPSLIEMANLDGTNRRVLISQNIKMPFALTLYQDYIYWADWDTGVIESALKTNGNNRSKIYSQLDSIPDMVVYHQSRQIGKNPCSLNNGDCSHLCLSVPSMLTSGKQSLGYKCACPTHYTLNRDNETCSAPNEFILFSHRNGVGRVIIGGQDCPDATLSGLKAIKAIEYDPLYRNIYWIDGRARAIKFMPENGIGTISVLTVDVDITADMALDAIGRAVYFSSPETNSINVTKLDNTSSVGVIIQGEKFIPKYIVVHPTKRLLFWADINQGIIMSSAMDGSNRTEIGKAPNISSLTLDTFADTVYWANAKQIYACSLNGNNKRTIWQGGVVISLSVLNSTLYWIDGERQLMHLPLEEINAPALPVTRVLHITDVVAVHKTDMKHPCAGGGKCGGVCLADGKCGCVRGLSTQGSPSHCGRPPPCATDYFACTTNSPVHTIHSSDRSQLWECLPNTWKCDGILDCPNGADENDCNTCPVDKFKCPDGACIDSGLVCDGIRQCSDGHDELNCCNGPHNYKCPNTGICIASSELCNQWDRCDGTDDLPVECAQRIESPAANMKILYIFILLGLVLLVFPTLGILYCRRKLASNRFSPDDRAGDPLSPKLMPHNIKVSNVCPSTSNNSRAIKMGNKIMEGMRMSTLNSSSTNSYDRNHITGASSSATNGSSFVGRYPREPLNPPPSPATTAPSSSAASRHRPYRHYRAINQPPPPTPCSTDVCDESDCTISYPTLGLGMYLEAPPPTPCPTSPPSPSSRSSAYFSPLPPPPSPVPPHYDS